MKYVSTVTVDELYHWNEISTLNFERVVCSVVGCSDNITFLEILPFANDTSLHTFLFNPILHLLYLLLVQLHSLSFREFITVLLGSAVKQSTESTILAMKNLMANKLNAPLRSFCSSDKPYLAASM